jgi:hypothetical protein
MVINPGGERFGAWHKDVATFFTARLPPKEILNRRLPGITQRNVFFAGASLGKDH